MYTTLEYIESNGYELKFRYGAFSLYAKEVTKKLTSVAIVNKDISSVWNTRLSTIDTDIYNLNIEMLEKYPERATLIEDILKFSK